MTARYICIEGTEGVGKTTQTQKLVDYLRSKGHKVLHTKEPGTLHAPLTMELRGIMLDAKHEGELTKLSRELISQAIRSIHLEKVIVPALNEYDYIVQDRGILSGYAYGMACGNSYDRLSYLASELIEDSGLETCAEMLYDDVVYLTGNVKKGLNKAISSKQEFEAGDAIEMKGLPFMEQVNKNMRELSEDFDAKEVNTDAPVDELFDEIMDSKTIDEVFSEILKKLKLEIE